MQASWCAARDAAGPSHGHGFILQVWILTGRTRDMYREMWVAAMDDMERRLVRTSADGYQYVGSLKGCGRKPLQRPHTPADLAVGQLLPSCSNHTPGPCHAHTRPLSWPAWHPAAHIKSRACCT